MTLLDFLLEAKYGNGDYLLTSNTDEYWGYDNVREGKYFKLEDMFSCDTEWAIQDYCEDEPFADWLDRDIVEVETICDFKAIRNYFEGGYEKMVSPCSIIICVEGEDSDKEIWENEENLEEPIDDYQGFPKEEDWPYILTYDTYKKLRELVWTGNKRVVNMREVVWRSEAFFYEAMHLIMEKGASAIREMTEEDIAKIEEEANEKGAEANSQEKEDAKAYVRNLKFAKELVDSVNSDDLLLFFGIYPGFRSLWYKKQ